MNTDIKKNFCIKDMDLLNKFTNIYIDISKKRSNTRCFGLFITDNDVKNLYTDNNPPKIDENFINSKKWDLIITGNWNESESKLAITKDIYDLLIKDELLKYIDGVYVLTPESSFSKIVETEAMAVAGNTGKSPLIPLNATTIYIGNFMISEDNTSIVKDAIIFIPKIINKIEKSGIETETDNRWKLEPKRTETISLLIN